jgi:PAS domain S-box-containing protein
MKPNYYSLKYAVIIPLIALIILILSIEAIISKFDYRFLAKEQGSKIVHALNETTQSKLSHLIIDPMHINEIIGQELETKNLDTYSLKNIEGYLYNTSMDFPTIMPQVSALSYGDEYGNFVGYRITQNGYNLMLKDDRTSGYLNIYSGQNDKTDILAQYESYDPRTRPWYVPVKENQVSQISDIYINYDEKMESSITFISPVFNDNHDFKGVMGMDIKLDGINHFLKNDPTKGNGVIYIINQENEVIAHSGEEPVMTLTNTDPPTGTLTHISNSENPLIQASSSVLDGDNIEYDTVLQAKLNNNHHYMLVSDLREPSSLDWRIVVIIPETDLMADIRTRNSSMLGILIAISVIGLAFVLTRLNHITDPIIKNTAIATKIASGAWDVPIPKNASHIKEIEELSSAITILRNNIKSSFEEIKFKEERYRSLVENVDAMIYSLTPDGIFKSINHSVEKELLMDRSNIVGRHFSNIFEKQKNIDFWQTQIDCVIKTKEKVHTQFEHMNSNGERIIMTITLIPLLDDDDNILMIIGANFNITDLIEAQEEIESLHASEKERLGHLVNQRTQELERVMEELVNKEKLASLGSLVSGIAHEINTPLGVAVSAASLLETTNKHTIQALHNNQMDKDSLIAYIKHVDETEQILSNNLKRASELVKSFKNIAVSQSVEKKLTFNVYDYIQSILLSLKHEYKNKHHTFELLCPENLTIHSYSGAFSQILTNFIMNSIIHGFKNQNGGHVIIEVVENKSTYKIIYSDNGVGMTEEVSKHIFEPFYTTNRGQGGSGLGLNVVYNIVTGQLGGSIICSSTPNKGTTFTIEFDKE